MSGSESEYEIEAIVGYRSEGLNLKINFFFNLNLFNR